MTWRLRTPQGNNSTVCASRPRTGVRIIKSVMGFRQFLLRGLDCVRGEWSLVTMAWNSKRCMRSARLSAFDTRLDRAWCLEPSASGHPQS